MSMAIVGADTDAVRFCEYRGGLVWHRPLFPYFLSGGVRRRRLSQLSQHLTVARST
jgi:hypothetical protein